MPWTPCVLRKPSLVPNLADTYKIIQHQPYLEMFNMYVYISIYICIYTHTYVRADIHTYMCICVCIYIYVQTHITICIHAYVWVSHSHPSDHSSIPPCILYTYLFVVYMYIHKLYTHGMAVYRPNMIPTTILAARAWSTTAIVSA